MSTGPPPPIVVAFGGNAISPAGERDSIASQFRQTRRTVRALSDLFVSERPIVITHGNGPQVGAAVLRNELAAQEVYEVPLDILVADLQGGMGFMIGQCIANELRRRGVVRPVATIITTVEVDGNDPALDDPSKPIGPFYEVARRGHLEELGWDLLLVPGRGLRRVVPSPRPRAILEIEVLRGVIETGAILIAVGGGGVPVARDGDGGLTGREAVIDKDLATALLARALGAETMLNITGVARVCLDFGTPEERPLARLDAAEAARHLEAGQFPRGSMGPKIEAAVEFLRDRDHERARAVITDIDHVVAALAGRAGTTIVPEPGTGHEADR